MTVLQMTKCEYQNCGYLQVKVAETRRRVENNNSNGNGIVVVCSSPLVVNSEILRNFAEELATQTAHPICRCECWSKEALLGSRSNQNRSSSLATTSFLSSYERIMSEV